MGNGGIAEILSWHRGRAPQPGKLVDDTGRGLGTHRGVEHYTIGQRRGLKLGGGTEGLVVQQLDPQSNTVVVAQRGSYPVKRLVLTDFTDLAPGRWREGETVMARGRYRQPLWNAEVHSKDGKVTVEHRRRLHMAHGSGASGTTATRLFVGIIESVDTCRIACLNTFGCRTIRRSIFAPTANRHLLDIIPSAAPISHHRRAVEMNTPSAHIRTPSD